MNYASQPPTAEPDANLPGNVTMCHNIIRVILDLNVAKCRAAQTQECKSRNANSVA